MVQNFCSLRERSFSQHAWWLDHIWPPFSLHSSEVFSIIQQLTS